MSSKSVNKKKALIMTSTTMPTALIASSSSNLPPMAFVAKNIRAPSLRNGATTKQTNKLFTKSAIANSTLELTTPFDPSTLLQEGPIVVPDLLKKSLRTKLNVPFVPTEGAQNNDRPVIVGHRGALYEQLENTLEGFMRSHEMGCDAVELDVFLLKCGTLVVFHGGGTDENPGDLTDYCNLPFQSILDYTAEEARQVKFNPHFAEFACGPQRVQDDSIAYIPTLHEVLTNIKTKTNMHVKIELKGPGTAEPVLELVEALDMVDRCHFSSFDHVRIARIRELRPQIDQDGKHVYKTGALFNEVPEDYLERSLSVGASEVHLRYDTCTSDRIQDIHNAGMGSMLWMRGPKGMKSDTMDKYHDVGNEDIDMYKVLIQTGVKQLCVNKPNVLVDILVNQSLEEAYQ